MSDKEMERIISANLKKLLKEYNINQNQLAKIAEVSESTAGKWILKKSTPRMGAIQKIADHFNLPKSYILEEQTIYENKPKLTSYHYFPVAVSAGLPINIDPISDSETITIPDELLGKYARSKEIFFMRVNGESMNKIIPHDSLIAVKRVSINELKNGDIVVYSNHHDYAVKRFYDLGEKIIFKPESTDPRFTDYIVGKTSEDIRLHGKVVTYIVNLD